MEWRAILIYCHPPPRSHLLFPPSPPSMPKAQVIMTDTYYDLPGEALSTANVWLRSRSGVWELKVCMYCFF